MVGARSSAFEHLARMALHRPTEKQLMADFRRWQIPALRELSERINLRIRRAPYTDDTWQMLDDLGIEPGPRRHRFPTPTIVIGIDLARDDS